MPQERQSLAALVTGGSRGIGRVIAMQLAQRGLRIALHYRNNRDTADAALADLPGKGHSLFDTDLADPDATTGSGNASSGNSVASTSSSTMGLNALSQSLAKALAPRAIYVYCVAPGWVETEMAAGHLTGPDGPAVLAQHPLGRVNRTDEVAAAAVYCALDAPPAMTGGVIDVNGASYLRT